MCGINQKKGSFCTFDLAPGMQEHSLSTHIRSCLLLIVGSRSKAGSTSCAEEEISEGCPRLHKVTVPMAPRRAERLALPL